MLDRIAPHRQARHRQGAAQGYGPDWPSGRDDREILLEGAFNIRDLGGLTVTRHKKTTRGLVYRADSLDSLTHGDRAILFGDLGIGTVLDLRTPEEAGGDGLSDARLFPTLRVRSFPVIPDGRIGVEPFPVGDPTAIAGHYLEYVVDRATIVAGAIEAIAESVEPRIDGVRTPALFHCAAGRDRTGVVAAVILALLGVSDRQIVADYLASNRQAVEVSRRLTLNPLYQGDEAVAAGTNLVDAEAMSQFLERFRSKFGSARAWALGAGIPESTLDAFVATMVTSAPIASIMDRSP
jgi:protein-tyrosine phosphatase